MEEAHQAALEKQRQTQEARERQPHAKWIPLVVISGVVAMLVVGLKHFAGVTADWSSVFVGVVFMAMSTFALLRDFIFQRWDWSESIILGVVLFFSLFFTLCIPLVGVSLQGDVLHVLSDLLSSLTFLIPFTASSLFVALGGLGGPGKSAISLGIVRLTCDCLTSFLGGRYRGFWHA